LLREDGTIVFTKSAASEGYDFRELIPIPRERDEADQGFRQVVRHGGRECSARMVDIPGMGLVWLAGELQQGPNELMLYEATELPAIIAATTARELQVAVLLGQGRSTHEIAQRLFISPHTVARHIEKLRRRYNLPCEKPLAITCARLLRGLQILLEVRGIEYPK